MPRKQRFKPSRKPKPVVPPPDDAIIQRTRDAPGPDEMRQDVSDSNPLSEAASTD